MPSETTGTVGLRPARAADAAGIAACARAAYAIYVERIGREPAPMVADFPGQIADGLVAVLEESDDLLGFIVHFPRDEDYFIENVALDPRAQGRGLGRRIMAWVEEQARAAGQTRLRLYTNVKMTENIPFYEGLGFVEEGRVVEDGFHRVYFVKDLAG